MNIPDPQEQEFHYPPQYKVRDIETKVVYTLNGTNDYEVVRSIAHLTNKRVESFKIISWPDMRDLP